jgi:hypothetical protein
VIRTDVPSSQYPDSSHIPHADKFLDDDGQPLGTKLRTVFREHKRRPYFFNNSEHFKNKTRTCSGDSSTLTGRADVLAGESPADNIDVPPPGVPVEGPDVIPDREFWQTSVALSVEKSASAVGINLNSTDGAPSKQV